MEMSASSLACVTLTILGVMALLLRFVIGGSDRTKQGPAGTEQVARDAGCQPGGEGDYDAKMRQLWGGPAPKFFQQCWEDWPKRFRPAGDRVRTALITGGTGGIGFYVAKLLARLGYEIILPARTGFEDEAHGAVAAIKRDVPGAKVLVPAVALDLDSLQSVRDFAASVQDLAAGGLDLLCLNAGRGGSKGDAREVTADGLEAIMHVNALGHYLLVAELMPLLMAAPHARVVSQSSMARVCTAPGFNSNVRRSKVKDLNGTDASRFNAFHQYALSKACNCFFTLGLNDRLAKAGIDSVVAIVADPGFASTGVNIQHNLGHSFLPLPNGWLSTKTMHSVGGAQHAADGALPMVLACVDPSAERNDWYTPENEMGGRAVKRDPSAHKDAKTDPINIGSEWPKDTREVFWTQAEHCTGATWKCF